MNKIRIKVDRNINYVCHMNAVAKCNGRNEYVSDYASKYARLHALEDLEIVKHYEGHTEYSPQMSEVLKRNFDIYIYNIWYEVRSGLMEYAESLQKRFNESDFTEQADKAAGVNSKDYFHVCLCDAIRGNGGIAEDGQLLIGMDMTVEEAFCCIQEEYRKYIRNN